MILFQSVEFLNNRIKPVIGAKKNPRKNHNQAFLFVVCAQYAQKIPKRNVTKP